MRDLANSCCVISAFSRAEIKILRKCSYSDVWGDFTSEGFQIEFYYLINRFWDYPKMGYFRDNHRGGRTMHIGLRVLIALVAALATVSVVVALGGKPGVATGAPGAVVAFIAWWMTGRTRGSRS